MPYRYLKDPLFLVCFVTYWVNRFLEDLGVSSPITRSYLNDLICIPFWVPIMVWGSRKLRLRNHDRPPLAHEIVVPLLIWAAVFEVILPSMPRWSGLAYADPNDVLCYTLGALLASLFWTRWYVTT